MAEHKIRKIRKTMKQKHYFSISHTWDNVVVKGPCDSGYRDATDSTRQHKALSFVEGHISEQLGEDGMSVDHQGRSPTVLPD